MPRYNRFAGFPTFSEADAEFSALELKAEVKEVFGQYSSEELERMWHEYLEDTDE